VDDVPLSVHGRGECHDWQRSCNSDRERDFPQHKIGISTVSDFTGRRVVLPTTFLRECLPELIREQSREQASLLVRQLFVETASLQDV
jgi:hypothetical protein